MLEERTLEAARHEFLRHGIVDASMSRIADAANVSKSALYRRYGSKRGLFLRMADAQTEALRRAAEGVTADLSDPIEVLRHTAKAHVNFVLDPRTVEIQRLYVSDARALAELPASSDHFRPQVLNDQIDTQIRRAQQAGKIQAGEPALWRDVLIRLVLEGPRWKALITGRSPDDDEIEADFQRMWAIFEMSARPAEPA